MCRAKVLFGAAAAGARGRLFELLECCSSVALSYSQPRFLDAVAEWIARRRSEPAATTLVEALLGAHASVDPPSQTFGGLGAVSHRLAHEVVWHLASSGARADTHEGMLATHSALVAGWIESTAQVALSSAPRDADQGSGQRIRSFFI